MLNQFTQKEAVSCSTVKHSLLQVRAAVELYKKKGQITVPLLREGMGTQNSYKDHSWSRNLGLSSCCCQRQCLGNAWMLTSSCFLAALPSGVSLPRNRLCYCCERENSLLWNDTSKDREAIRNESNPESLQVDVNSEGPQRDGNA